MKQKSNTKKRGCVRAIGKALMVFSLAAAVMAAGLPIQAKAAVVKVATASTYKDKEGHYEANIKTPKAMGSGKGISTLNAQMKAYTDGLKKSYLADKKAAPDGREVFNTSYDVVTNNSSIVSIGIHTGIAMGGSNAYSVYFNLDKNTGKVLKLKDLFQDKADYVSIITKNVISQMKEKMAKDKSVSYFVSTDKDNSGMDLFTGIQKDQSFYINKKGNLVVAFAKYEAAPGYMGEVSFVIPTKAIASILNETAPIK